MKALTVVDRIFSAGILHFLFGQFQLLKSGQRGFIGKIIFSGIHHAQTQLTSPGCNGRTGHKPDILIQEDFLFAGGSSGMGIAL